MIKNISIDIFFRDYYKNLLNFQFLFIIIIISFYFYHNFQTIS